MAASAARAGPATSRTLGYQSSLQVGFTLL